MAEGPAGETRDDLIAGITALEGSGAAGFDPVRFRFIRTMALRSRELEGAVAEIVAAKAQAALAAYVEELSLAQADSAGTAERAARDFPAAAAQIHQYFQAGEFRALKRLDTRLRRPSRAGALGALTQSLDQHSLAPLADEATGPGGQPVQAPVELKAARYFRDTLGRQLADRLVSQIAQEAPTDSGPLNPQRLAVRSLAAMRRLSPRYLGRFVSYVDTLFWLDKAGEKLPP